MTGCINTESRQRDITLKTRTVKGFFTKFKFNRVNEKCLTPVSHRMFNERQKNGTHC